MVSQAGSQIIIVVQSILRVRNQACRLGTQPFCRSSKLRKTVGQGIHTRLDVAHLGSYVFQFLYSLGQSFIFQIQGRHAVIFFQQVFTLNIFISHHIFGSRVYLGHVVAQSLHVYIIRIHISLACQHLTTQVIQLRIHFLYGRRAVERTILGCFQSLGQRGLGRTVVDFILHSRSHYGRTVYGSCQQSLIIGRIGRFGNQFHSSQKEFVETTLAQARELQHVITLLCHRELRSGKGCPRHWNILSTLHARLGFHTVEPGYHLTFCIRIVQINLFEREVIFRERTIGKTFPCRHTERDLIFTRRQMESHTRIHFRIQSPVGHHIVFHLFAISSRTYRTASSTPIKSHTIKITGIRTLQTASSTTDVTTPVIIPDLTGFRHTILVDGSIIIRQPPFRESTVGIRGKVFRGRINHFTRTWVQIRSYGEIYGL